MIISPKVFVINLEKSKDRLENVKRQFSKLKQDFEIFKGIDGFSAPHTVFPFLWGKLDFLDSKGHAGCALSHYNLWKKIVEENIKYSCILEDDIFLVKRIENINISSYTDFDILYINDRIQALHSDKLACEGCGLDGYIVTSESCKKLIQICEDLNVPIDLRVEAHAEGFRKYKHPITNIDNTTTRFISTLKPDIVFKAYVEPNCYVKNLKTFKSTIDIKNPLIKKIEGRLGKVWDKKPNVPLDDQGWFSFQNQQLLKKILNKKTSCVVELGSWLGKSTRFILDNAQNSIVFAVDTWLGGPEHNGPNGVCKEKLPTLFETFLVNCWDYKHRLYPLKMTTIDGLNFLFNEGILPDVIYIDADHTYEAVLKDIEISIQLFPNAVIVGDDWGWGEKLPVQKAAKEMANKYKKHIEVEGGWAWRFL